MGDDTYKREAQILREAGRPLAKVRDAKVLVDSLDTLIAHFERRLKSASVVQLRQSLIERRNELRKQVIQRDWAIGGIGRRIWAARKRIDQWRLQKAGGRRLGAVKSGLRPRPPGDGRRERESDGCGLARVA